MTGKRFMERRLAPWVLGAVLFVLAVSAMAAGELAEADTLAQQGNYAEALTLYRNLLFGQEENQQALRTELTGAIFCLNRLNRIGEFDQLMNRVLTRHSGVASLLQAAAKEYMTVVHFGRSIDGRFERGYRTGNAGRSQITFARDRVLALRLYAAAMPLAEKEYSTADKKNFYWEFAQAVRQADEHGSAWKLAFLTDLDTLPAPEPETFRYHDRHPAPVTADGSPLFYHLPGAWEQAANDGERWRWLLNRGAANGDAARVALCWADFLRSQFEVATLRNEDSGAATGDDGTITYKLSQLTDDETIARLGSGLQRFRLPPEFNYLTIYRQWAERGEQAAARALADVYLNRGQYDKAEAILRQCSPAAVSDLLFQLTGNLACFEPVAMQSDVVKPKLTFRYRNAESIQFSAYRIRTDELLRAMKKHLRGNPAAIDSDGIKLGTLGYRMVRENNARYLEEKIASWRMILKPGLGHRDTLATTELPFHGAGAYWIRAELPGGYSFTTVAWLTSAIVVKKNLGNNTLFYVADAATGVPLNDADLDFFGYRQQPLKQPERLPNGQLRRVSVRTMDVNASVDINGLYYTEAAKFPDSYDWLLEVRQQGRLVAVMGFSRFWSQVPEVAAQDRVRHYLITDRPVYQAGDTVKFKIWSARNSLLQDMVNPFAGEKATVAITNAAGQEVDQLSLTYDRFGGLDGQYVLPAKTPAGSYRLAVLSGLTENRQSCGSFHVAVFRPPEFEVKLESPKNGMPSDAAVPITVKADYLSGGPVSQGEVLYTITRTAMSAQRFPAAPWDWLYGAGYWWNDTEGPNGDVQAGGTVYEKVLSEKVASGVARLDKNGVFRLHLNTAEARRLFGARNEIYQVEVKVTDSAQRTVTTSCQLPVTAQSFYVWCWPVRNYYQDGDTVRVNVAAVNAADGTTVTAHGDVVVYELGFTGNKKVETQLGSYPVVVGTTESPEVRFRVSRPGMYRLVCHLTDENQKTFSSDYVFPVVGNNIGRNVFRNSGLKIMPDKREYRNGDMLNLLITTDRPDITVLLFTRDGKAPEVVKMNGQRLVKELKITAEDMPDFFIQAIGVADGQVLSDTVRIPVPPEKKILQLKVEPASPRTSPGDPLKVKLKLTDMNGLPVSGSVVVAVYDQTLDELARGARENIKAFFWKWLRHFNATYESNLLLFNNLLAPGQPAMRTLGCFNTAPGPTAVARHPVSDGRDDTPVMTGFNNRLSPLTGNVPETNAELEVLWRGSGPETAFWTTRLQTDAEGSAEFRLRTPNKLTTWKIRAWAMGDNTAVGEGEAEVLCTKDFLIRLLPPRFLVAGDKIKMTAVIHNYLFEPISGKIELDVQGALQLNGGKVKRFSVDTAAVATVEWPITAGNQGMGKVVMKAMAGKYVDGLTTEFPVIRRGSERQPVICGCIGTDADTASIKFLLPSDVGSDATRLTVRFSPSLATVVAYALPALLTCEYQSVEQTMNRFLPLLIVRKTLSGMGLNQSILRGVEKPAAAVPNSASYGVPQPLYSDSAADALVTKGLAQLARQQLSDGGWGWFFSAGEPSSPHITAQVVYGLMLTNKNGVYVNSELFQRGIEYLRNYQLQQLNLLSRADKKTNHPETEKAYADNLDALVFMVLTAAGTRETRMQEYLYRDRNYLSVCGKVLLTMALAEIGDQDEAKIVSRNIAEALQTNADDSSAWLDAGELTPWWTWYGSRIETTALYLMFLSRYGADNELKTASMLARYLANNRSHYSYWNSTRDTALCLEALCEYLQRTGELNAEQNVKVFWNSQRTRDVKITRDNLFGSDCTFTATGTALKPGEQIIKLRRDGIGPLYYAAALFSFDQETPIAASGQNIQVSRTYYRIHANSLAERNDQTVEQREKINPDKTMFRCGDLVEVELTVACANDYEYILLEDFRPAGMKTLDLTSRYQQGKVPYYQEYRNDRVTFFFRSLPQGRYHFTYRLQAENPGEFTALPARIYGMYAPELSGNSNTESITIDANPGATAQP